MRQLTARQRQPLANTAICEFTGTPGAEATGEDEGTRIRTFMTIKVHLALSNSVTTLQGQRD